MSVYLDIKSLYPHLKVNWNVLLCKICIARRLVVDIFPWCNAHYVPFPSGTLVARRMGNGSIKINEIAMPQWNPNSRPEQHRYRMMLIIEAQPTCSLTWCALHMRSRSCLLRNLPTISIPNVKETPRSFSPQPATSLSGSDHSKSQSNPTKQNKNKYHNLWCNQAKWVWSRKNMNFGFLAFSIRVCLGFNLVKTPLRLGNIIGSKDTNSWWIEQTVRNKRNYWLCLAVS